jgi:hypothetical protein
MKNFPIPDIMFIIISAIIISVIIGLDLEKFLSQFSIIFMLISYFTGKYISRIEVKKRSQLNNN